MCIDLSNMFSGIPVDDGWVKSTFLMYAILLWKTVLRRRRILESYLLFLVSSRSVCVSDTTLAVMLC